MANARRSELSVNVSPSALSLCHFRPEEMTIFVVAISVACLHGIFSMLSSSIVYAYWLALSCVVCICIKSALHKQ